MSNTRRFAGLATLAAGAAAGAALERVLYRRVFDVADPERNEPIGGVPGRTSWVEARDGTRLYTRSYGPEDAKGTIVFAHGMTNSHIVWHYQLRDLRTDGRYKLVAYDARGHGNSGPARGPDGTTKLDGDTLGKDLAAVVDQATTGPVILVGHSLGGMTALSHLIADRKERERVTGAVIVCSTFTGELGWSGRNGTMRKIFDRIGEAGQRVVGDNPGLIDRFRIGTTDMALLIARSLFGDSASPRHVHIAFRMFNETPAQTISAAVDLVSFNVYEDLGNIDVPVLVVAGSRDVLTPEFLGREMHKVIGGCELVVLDGCGHMAPFERYDELTSHIRKFAERVLP